MEKSFSEKVAEAQAVVASITAQEAHARKDNDPSVVFIDPRDPGDIISTGIIPGALNTPLSQLSSAALPDELASKSRPIITSCGAGPMGALAAYALQQRGYNNVVFVDGGTKAWVEAGYATNSLQ